MNYIIIKNSDIKNGDKILVEQFILSSRNGVEIFKNCAEKQTLSL